MDLLVDVRISNMSPDVENCLSRVRVLRRRLAEYYNERARENGSDSIVVEVFLGGEPCFLLLDTGAEMLTIPQSLIEADQPLRLKRK